MSIHWRFRPLSYILAAGMVVVMGAVAFRLWPAGRSVPPLSITQIQSLLPKSSLLHSLARLEVDGRSPQEVAVVGVIPQYPGASASAYYGFVFGYDRWQRRFRTLHAQAMPGPVPRPADAIALDRQREAALFAAHHDDGTLAYQIVGMAHGVRVLHEGRASGRLHVAGTALIEGGSSRQALIWDGRAFQAQVLPAVSLPPPGAIWRYRAQNGMIVARTPVVHLQPRQSIRLAKVGGGPVPVILPDLRLDVQGDNVFRARHPGTYTISILIPFNPPELTYRLTLIVE